MTAYPTKSLAAHPPFKFPAYKGTIDRAPTRPLVVIPQTLTELTGPIYGHESVKPGDSVGAPTQVFEYLPADRIRQQVYAYDSAGLVDFYATFRADQTMSLYIDYDQSGTQSWGTRTITYGAAGVISNDYLVYDDSHTSSDVYDALGRLDYQLQTRSNGTTSLYTNYDQGAGQTWSSITYG